MFHYERRFGRRLWQRYGYEQTLRDEEATLSVARYIIENPLRACLVERVEDYPYLGSSMYTVDQICGAIQMTLRWKRGRSALRWTRRARPPEGGHSVGGGRLKADSPG